MFVYYILLQLIVEPVVSICWEKGNLHYNCLFLGHQHVDNVEVYDEQKMFASNQYVVPAPEKMIKYTYILRQQLLVFHQLWPATAR